MMSNKNYFTGNVDISNLKKYLLKKFPGILALHEFHTWTFTPGTLVLTGHIMYQAKTVYTDINRQVETFLYSQGFSKVTIQPEFPHSPNPSVEDITSCALKCKVSENYAYSKRKNIRKCQVKD